MKFVLGAVVVALVALLLARVVRGGRSQAPRRSGWGATAWAIAAAVAWVTALALIVRAV